MREYDGSPSYEEHAVSNDIKQKCLDQQCSPHVSRSSIITDGNFCSDIINTFSYKSRGRTKDNYYYYYYYYYCYYYYYYPVLPGTFKDINKCQLVNLNNITVIYTYFAVAITVGLNVEILPTGEESGGRGGHYPIMQYPDKGHRSWITNTFLYEV
jgi:hypothetical protein